MIFRFVKSWLEIGLLFQTILFLSETTKYFKDERERLKRINAKYEESILQ